MDSQPVHSPEIRALRPVAAAFDAPRGGGGGSEPRERRGAGAPAGEPPAEHPLVRALRARAADLGPLGPALRALEEALDGEGSTRLESLRAALGRARHRIGSGGAELAAIPRRLGLDHEARLLERSLARLSDRERSALGRPMLERLVALLGRRAGGLRSLVAAVASGAPAPRATPDEAGAPGFKALLLAALEDPGVVDPPRRAMRRVLAGLEAHQLLALAARAGGGEPSWSVPVEGPPRDGRSAPRVEARVRVSSTRCADGGAAYRASLEVDRDGDTARVELALRAGAWRVRVDADGQPLRSRLVGRLPDLERRLAGPGRRVEVALDRRTRDAAPEIAWLDEHLLLDLRG